MSKISTTLFLLIAICLFQVPNLDGQTESGSDLNLKQDRRSGKTQLEQEPSTGKSNKKPRTPEYAKQSHVYKKVNGRNLSLYVNQPSDWKPSDQRAAAVFFHGGGWVGGTPGQFDEHCKHLVKLGMVTVQVQYRLLGRPSKKEADPTVSDPDKTPTRCIQDAKSALRWVRKNADTLGIDPNRIAAGGGSAGGHLAAFLGTTDGIDDPHDDRSISARANAMLLFNPVYNNGPGGWGTARVGNRYQEFSPAHNITKDDAPAIVFLGTNDKLVSVETAKQFQQQMRDYGIVSELHLYEGAQHGFFNYQRDDGKWYRLTIAELDNFLIKLGWIAAAPSK